MLEKVIQSDWKEAIEDGTIRADGGFPGSPMVKDPPVSAGDMDSIPAPGISHMLWGS